MNWYKTKLWLIDVFFALLFWIVVPIIVFGMVIVMLPYNVVMSVPHTLFNIYSGTKRALTNKR